MSPLSQNTHPNLKKKFLILNYTKPLVIAGFEQLFSSLCCRVMAETEFGLKGQIMPFLKSWELGKKLCFWPIILATDVLASQSRALKTGIFT